MPVAAFDTHKYAKQLKQAGVSDEQVEAQVSALAEAMQSGSQDLATKNDILLIKQDIASVKQELKHEIALLRQEQTIIKWLLGITLTGVLGTLAQTLVLSWRLMMGDGRQVYSRLPNQHNTEQC